MERWRLGAFQTQEQSFNDLGGKNQYLIKAQGSMRRLNQHLVFKAREKKDAPKDRHKGDLRCA